MPVPLDTPTGARAKARSLARRNCNASIISTLMVRSIRSALSSTGVDVTLIFTDTHAALNGHKREAIYSYYAELTAHAATRRVSR